LFFLWTYIQFLYRKTQIKIIRGFSALAHQNEEKCYLDARGNKKINKK
jgi:hypothetical protein